MTEATARLDGTEPGVDGKMRVKRRFRFGLKSLLVLTTAACVVLAILAGPLTERRRQQRLLDELVARGAAVSTDGSVHRASLGCMFLALFDSTYDEYPLYRLDFSGVGLTDRDLPDLVRLRHIQHLILSRTRVTDSGMPQLARLEHLTLLDLSGTQVTDEGIAHLGTATRLDRLNVLQTTVTYAALERLDAQLPYAHFCEQRAIDELKAAGVQVVHRPNYVDLDDPLATTVRDGEIVHDVIVGMNKTATFSSAQVKQLNYLPSLKRLILFHVTFGPEGLTGLKRLPNLKCLEFKDTNLTDRDLEAIGRQTQLEELWIIESGITSKGLTHLSSLVNLKELRIVECDNVTSEAFAELRSELARRKPAELEP